MEAFPELPLMGRSNSCRDSGSPAGGDGAGGASGLEIEEERGVTPEPLEGLSDGAREATAEGA